MRKTNQFDTDLTFSQCVRWSKTHDLIANRVAIVNQMHGCRYDNCVGNPCVLRHLGGLYEVRYCDTVVASYALYDLNTANKALGTVDKLNDVLWNGRREGYMRLLPALG